MNRFGSDELADYLPYSQPNLFQEEIAAVAEVLRGTMISQGSALETFESDWKEFTGAEFAVAFSSGSAALHGMCFAAGLQPGDEVILPALTFASSANAILHLGATPVFADIDLDTFCINCDDIAHRLTPKTKAILAVDFAGRPCDYRRLRAICNENGLALLADAAHSAGASSGESNSGTLADLTAFSFNPVKNMTSAEGGMVTGAGANMRALLTRFRSHGMTRESNLLMHPAPASWYYEQQYLGFNYKLSELHAALGVVQLRRLADFNAARERLAKRYLDELALLPLELPSRFDDGVHAWHLFVVRLQDYERRDSVFERLRQSNIGVQLHYMPVPMHPYFVQAGYTMEGLSESYDYFRSAISLPLHPGVTEAQQDFVIQRLTELLA